MYVDVYVVGCDDLIVNLAGIWSYLGDKPAVTPRKNYLD